MESWSIHLYKEYFKFSCAHFLIFPNGSRERLHGHNYHVEAWIEGDLSDRGLVIDFIQVKPVIRELCDALDEHWLVPGEHPELKIDSLSDGSLEIRYRDARFITPSDDVLVLPINNTSVENLASWFAHELRKMLAKRFPSAHVRSLRVSISETSGQSGIYEISDDR